MFLFVIILQIQLFYLRVYWQSSKPRIERKWPCWETSTSRWKSVKRERQTRSTKCHTFHTTLEAGGLTCWHKTAHLLTQDGWLVDTGWLTRWHKIAHLSQLRWLTCWHRIADLLIQDGWLVAQDGWLVDTGWLTCWRPWTTSNIVFGSWFRKVFLLLL